MSLSVQEVNTGTGVITGLTITDGGEWQGQNVVISGSGDLRDNPDLTPSFRRIITGWIEISEIGSWSDTFGVNSYTEDTIYFRVPSVNPINVFVNGNYAVTTRQPDGVWDRSAAWLAAYAGGSSSVTLEFRWWPSGEPRDWEVEVRSKIRVSLAYTVDSITINNGGYGWSVGDTLAISATGSDTSGTVTVASVNTPTSYTLNHSNITVGMVAGYTPTPPNIPGDSFAAMVADDVITNTSNYFYSYYGNSQFSINTTFDISDPNVTVNVVDSTLSSIELYEVSQNGTKGDRIDGKITFANQPGESELVGREPVCISVIDESTPAASDIRDDWLAFRSDNPNVPFYLLQPTYSVGPSALKAPAEFVNDPIAYGPIGVVRPYANRDSASDWFTIANLGNLQSGTRVYLSVDNSGSMTQAQVQADMDILREKCAAAGLTLIEFSMGGSERWSLNFLFQLANAPRAQSDIVQRFSPFDESWNVVYDTPYSSKNYPIYEILDIDTSSSEFDVLSLTEPLQVSADVDSILYLGENEDATLIVPILPGDTNVVVSKLSDAYLTSFEETISPDYEGYRNAIFFIITSVDQEVALQRQWDSINGYVQPTQSELLAEYNFLIEYTINSDSTVYAKEFVVTQYLYWRWQTTLEDGAIFDQLVSELDEVP